MGYEDNRGLGLHRASSANAGDIGSCFRWPQPQNAAEW